MKTLHSWSKPIVAAALLAFAPLPGLAQAGPVYPPPGGVSWTGSGSPITFGGATWSYTGLDHSAFDQLYWRFTQVANPWTSVQGFTGYMTPTFSSGNYFEYASTSNLNIWRADVNAWYSTPVILQAWVSGAPLTTLFGAPAVNLSNPAISAFSVTFRYIASGWAIGDLYNSLHHLSWDQLRTSAGGGFYYTDPVVSAVPEPSTVFLLAFGLLGVAYVAWRRREAPLEG